MSEAKDDDWFEKRPEKDRSEMDVIGRDQNGRPVYADRCVILQGTRRPDGSQRKNRRIRAEQLPDGSWKSFVPQDEIQAFETRAIRESRNRERRIPGWSSYSNASVNGSSRQSPVKVKLNQPPKKNSPAEQPQETRPCSINDTKEAQTEDNLKRRAKALRKRMKQIADLAEKASEGIRLDADQQEKLGRADAVKNELTDIEVQLAALSVSSLVHVE